MLKVLKWRSFFFYEDIQYSVSRCGQLLTNFDELPKTDY